MTATIGVIIKSRSSAFLHKISQKRTKKQYPRSETQISVNICGSCSIKNQPKHSDDQIGSHKFKNNCGFVRVTADIATVTIMFNISWFSNQKTSFELLLSHGRCNWRTMFFLAGACTSTNGHFLKNILSIVFYSPRQWFPIFKN